MKFSSTASGAAGHVLGCQAMNFCCWGEPTIAPDEVQSGLASEINQVCISFILPRQSRSVPRLSMICVNDNVFYHTLPEQATRL